MKELRKLPHGQWLHIATLPLGTTEESLSEFFRTIGLEIPAAAISVKEFPTKCGAFLSIPKHEVCLLFNWVLNGETLGGIKIEATVPFNLQDRAAWQK